MCSAIYSKCKQTNSHAWVYRRQWHEHKLLFSSEKCFFLQMIQDQQCKKFFVDSSTDGNEKKKLKRKITQRQMLHNEIKQSLLKECKNGRIKSVISKYNDEIIMHFIAGRVGKSVDTFSKWLLWHFLHFIGSMNVFCSTIFISRKFFNGKIDNYFQILGKTSKTTAEKPDTRDWLITRKLIGTWKCFLPLVGGMREVTTIPSLQDILIEDRNLLHNLLSLSDDTTSMVSKFLSFQRSGNLLFDLRFGLGLGIPNTAWRPATRQGNICASG